MSKPLTVETALLGDLESHQIAAAQVWELLKAVDHEFVPPLSVRESPRDTAFARGVEGTREPHRYFRTMGAQPVILAKHAGKLAGFLSFKPDYSYPDADFHSHAYVTTVAVEPSYRGGGIASALYDAVEDHLRTPGTERIVGVRTWSTNSSHLRLLERRGYTVRLRLPDDRGEGVDTVVMAKSV